MDWPQFVFDTPQGEEGTSAVTIHALDNGHDYDPENLFYRMAQLLHHRVNHEFAHRTPFPDMIRGALQMENIDDPQNGAQVTRVANIPVSQITGAQFMDLFFNVTETMESNPNLGIFDIQFTYWVNPHSLVFGSLPKYTSDFNGLLKLEYKIPRAYE